MSKAPEFPSLEQESEALKTLDISNSTHIPLKVTGPLECALQGEALLNSPFFNKGSAFTKREREVFGLEGLLPDACHSLDRQVARAYGQCLSRPNELSKNVFLTSLRYQNVVLFYKVLEQNIKELMSVIYTPTEGDAIQEYSHLFRRPEGVFLNAYKPEKMESILKAFGNPEDVDYIVVTDGDMILGIGDQGVGGIGISIAKLTLMTLCAGMHPHRTLPIVIDCGTNNETLLNDELYLGIRKPRLTGPQYDEYIDQFVHTVKRLYPKAMLHFEDFGVTHARRILDKYRGVLPCFNDDIQGTGTVTLAALYAACWISKLPLKDLKVVIFGAGTAGVGIADMIRDAIATEKKVSREEASKQIYLIDRPGLIQTTTSPAATEQLRYGKDPNDFSDIDTTSLKEIVARVKPHALIGTSTKPRAFTEDIVKEMAKHVEHPIIFPLSNPTRLHEAHPEDINAWTNGKALIATGSPFPPVYHGETPYEISECNNALVYPGIGLAAVLSRTKGITDSMLITATKALASLSPAVQENNIDKALLPDISETREVSCKIAVEMIKEIVEEGFNRVQGIPVHDDDELEEWVRDQMWSPVYRDLIAVDYKTSSRAAKGDLGIGRRGTLLGEDWDFK